MLRGIFTGRRDIGRGSKATALLGIEFPLLKNEAVPNYTCFSTNLQKLKRPAKNLTMNCYRYIIPLLPHLRVCLV